MSPSVNNTISFFVHHPLILCHLLHPSHILATSNTLISISHQLPFSTITPCKPPGPVGILFIWIPGPGIRLWRVKATVKCDALRKHFRIILCFTLIHPGDILFLKPVVPSGHRSLPETWHSSWYLKSNEIHELQTGHPHLHGYNVWYFLALRRWLHSPTNAVTDCFYAIPESNTKYRNPVGFRPF